MIVIELKERPLRPLNNCASSVSKRSVVVGNHKTSVSIEDEFWAGLKAIATAQGRPVSALLSEIDAARRRGNFSSAIRVYVLQKSIDIDAAKRAISQLG